VPETTIAHYLARRDDLPAQVDVIVLTGSAVLESVEVAARLHHATRARILITVSGHNWWRGTECWGAFLGDTGSFGRPTQERWLATYRGRAHPAVALNKI
jgi:hypothetical protein